MRRVPVLILCVWASLTLCAESQLSGTAISAYGWKGLDLGQQHIITIVGWQSQSAANVQLGIFEGANRADFMDAIPLFIVDESFDNRMNYQTITCSRGFRYVRFVAPDGKQNNLPTLEFWGEAGKGNDSQLCQLTNLPVVSIHTRNNQLPYDKEHEIDCFISIISNDGRTVLSDSAGIRERGNYSRGFPKKPYRIKFAHKHQVLGAPANAKKWTLINNWGDKTLMRNQLAFELSRRLGMPYTPFCAYVDVVLNGDYKGCYQLCDQIEVKKNRVDVTEMTTQDNSGEALTGGYLIEADAYADQEVSMFWSNKSTPVTIKYPKEDSITSQQTAYIKQRYNAMESDWKNSLDLNTFLRHFLVGETSGNTDTYWSTYFYKQRSNDTLYTGPCWDFDLAFDNDNRTYPIQNLTDYIYRTKGSTVGYMKRLADKIVVEDASARAQLLAIWAKARQNGLTEDSFIAYIDAQEAMLMESQHLNFLRWPIMNQYVHQNPRVWGSYANEVKNVRNYIKKRIPWMDNKLGFDASTLDVKNVETDDVSTSKYLQNGQLIIERNGCKYTVTGARIY